MHALQHLPTSWDRSSCSSFGVERAGSLSERELDEANGQIIRGASSCTEDVQYR